MEKKLEDLELSLRLFIGQPRKKDIPEGEKAYQEVQIKKSRRKDGSFESIRNPTILHVIAPDTKYAREAFNKFRDGTRTCTAKQVIYS